MKISLINNKIKSKERASKSCGDITNTTNLNLAFPVLHNINDNKIGGIN